MKAPRPAAALIISTALSVGIAGASLAEAARPITGKLSKPGYTVIALADSGKARSVRPKHGRFRLKPTSKHVTLHLRAKDGTYAGPIVVGRKAKQAIVGIKAGAHLGTVVVKAGKGYAKVKGRLPRGSLDSKRVARAKKGVPIGNGRNSGFVRSKPPRHAPRGDPDADGVPDTLDVDDNGNRVLDGLDRSSRARTAQTLSDFALHSVLGLPPEEVLNANAATVSPQDIDNTLSTANGAYLIVGVLPGAELDCGGSIQMPPRPAGLHYCSPGGSGRVFLGNGMPRTTWPRFPDDFDSDHDGMGVPPANGPFGGFFLSHGATSAEIGTGDIVIARTATEEVPATLEFVFATVPALVSYSDTAGHAAQARYPANPGDPGTNTNGFPAGAPPGQDVVLTLTLWRPQRQPIPPDENGVGGDVCLKETPPCRWVDIGGLSYAAIVQSVGTGPGMIDVAKGCPSSSLSSSDLQVTPGPGPNGGAAMLDPASDRGASPANTFTYTLNLTQCLAALGVPWNPGEPLGLTSLGLAANGGGDAEETVIFERQ